MAANLKEKMELAERLQAFIVRSGKSQRQLADELGVDESYISKLVNGVNNWTASRKYFGPLAKALNLTQDEIAELNPNVVIQFQAPAPSPITSRPVRLPEGLRQAIELYGKRFSDLLNPTWQSYLAGFQWRNGQPDDPEAWLDLYRDLTRAGIVPGDN